MSDGSIGSIGEGILRSDNYFTDGEMTQFYMVSQKKMRPLSFKE